MHIHHVSLKMSYVPPHKRHQKTGDAKPLPSLPPGTRKVSHSLRKNNDINTNNKSYINIPNHDIAMSKQCITKWFLVGLPDAVDDEDSTMISTFTRLERILVTQPNNLALVLKENYEEARREFSEHPWIFISEKVKDDFALSLQKVKDVIHGSEVGEIKPYVLVRFGKVLFNGHHLSDSEYNKGTLERSRKNFYAHVAPSFMQNTISDVVPRNGLELLEEKDLYLIILSDYTQPGLTISCKCEVNKETRSLQLRKFIVNPVRHFIADFTCLEKDLDLRLALLSKKNEYSVTEEALAKIQDLISCAIIDEDIKGGLKWPVGKMTDSGLHNIVSTWHITLTTFKNPSMKLKVRMVDRYDFKTSKGEIAREVFLKMTNIISKLGEEILDVETSFEMLKDNLELIWKQFLV